MDAFYALADQYSENLEVARSTARGTAVFLAKIHSNREKSQIGTIEKLVDAAQKIASAYQDDARLWRRMAQCRRNQAWDWVVDGGDTARTQCREAADEAELIQRRFPVDTAIAEQAAVARCCEARLYADQARVHSERFSRTLDFEILADVELAAGRIDYAIENIELLFLSLPASDVIASELIEALGHSLTLGRSLPQRCTPKWAAQTIRRVNETSFGFPSDGTIARRRAQALSTYVMLAAKSDWFASMALVESVLSILELIFSENREDEDIATYFAAALASIVSLLTRSEAQDTAQKAGYYSDKACATAREFPIEAIIAHAADAKRIEAYAWLRPENRSRLDNAREARKQVLKYGALYPESETLAWENASALGNEAEFWIEHDLTERPVALQALMAEMAQIASRFPRSRDIAELARKMAIIAGTD